MVLAHHDSDRFPMFYDDHVAERRNAVVNDGGCDFGFAGRPVAKNAE